MDGILFIACDKCDCVDSMSFTGGQSVCSECQTGQWHGLWEKEKFDPSRHHVMNRTSDFENVDEEGEPSFS